MALHKDFPQSPHAILDPGIRWFPADEALRETSMEKLMPPLVAELRRKAKGFRDGEYDFVYVDEESFEKYKPTSFRQLLEAFKEYKEDI